MLTSATAIGAAVLGPLYLRTAADSVVHTSVAAAAVDVRGATLSPRPGETGDPQQLTQAERWLRETAGLRGSYGPGVMSVITGLVIYKHQVPVNAINLFSRTGICAVLHFRSGACVLGPHDVLVSARAAGALKASVGSAIDIPPVGELRVTGIYDLPNLGLAYWWGSGSGDFAQGQLSGPDRIPELDPLIASQATALDVPARLSPLVLDQVPLRPATVGVVDQSAIVSGLSRARAKVGYAGVLLSSGLPSVLAGALQQQHVMSTIVAVAAVQLVLLAIWALSSMLLRSGDARVAEVRIARLRGFPLRSILMVTAAEPAFLCGLGALLGVGGAWGAVELAKHSFFDPAASVAPDGWTVVAFCVSLAAIAATLAFGTRRLVRSSKLELDRTSGAQGARRGRLIADVVLLVLSVVSLVALATSGGLSAGSNPVAAAAPGLIALGTAVVAVQAVLFVCRLGVLATADSSRVAAFLALRQVVRRPAILREAQVLIIALCLACFATSAWSVARTNRSVTAHFEVGTTTVATVEPQGVGLEQAVDRVDPHGRFAMAAVDVITPSSDVLGVNASRLPAVASWPRGVFDATVRRTSRLLDPPTAAEIDLPGSSVRVSATTSFITTPGPFLRNIELSMWVFNSETGTSIVNLGRLHAGPWSYEASLASVCPGGCRLSGFGATPVPGRSVPSSSQIQVGVSGIGVPAASGGYRALPLDLVSGDWRVTGQTVSLDIQPRQSMTFSFLGPALYPYEQAVGDAIAPMVSVDDHPAVLPGVVSTTVESINDAGAPGTSVPAQGLDGDTLSVAPAVSGSSLPRAGADAVMVDLDLLRRSQVAPTGPFSTDEVWLGPAAPADALARLRAAGLTIWSVQRASVVFSRLERAGPALADDFLLLATLVALLVAAASTLGSLGATIRQRATELTALEVAGVPRRALARALAIESGVLTLTATFGLVAGIVGAVMAIPSLPELATAPVVPLRYALPVPVIVAIACVVVAVVMAATASVASVLMRRMSPGLLRAAPNDAGS